MCLHFAPNASRFVSNCDFVVFIVEPHSANKLLKGCPIVQVATFLLTTITMTVYQQLIDDRMCGVCMHCL